MAVFPVHLRRSPFRRHAHLLELVDGVGRFFEDADAHAPEHVGRFGELDVVIELHLEAQQSSV